MKTAPFFSAPLYFALGAVFFAVPVHADVLVGSQSLHGTVFYDQGLGYAQFPITSGDYDITRIEVRGDTTAQPVVAAVAVYTGTISDNCGYSSSHLVTGANNIFGNGGVSDELVSVASTSLLHFSGTGYTPWYRVRYSDTCARVVFSIYHYNVLRGDNSSQMPFVALYSDSAIDWSAYQGIDWNAYSNPLPFSTTSIATSSALWASLSLASSTVQCSGNGFLSDSLCSVSAYLFLPNPQVFEEYNQLYNVTMVTKFPFSWFYSLQTVYTTISASSSANMASVSIPFQGSDPASSTAMGSLLPNITLLSTSTINHFMPAGMLATMLALESAAVWVLFGLYIYEEVQHKWLAH